ncbi:MAG: hypothetical protein WAV40_02150 [Microgenomates group bacterium]
MPTNITLERTTVNASDFYVVTARREIFGGRTLISPGLLLPFFPIALYENDSIRLRHLRTREEAVITQHNESTGAMFQIGSEELPIRLISHLWHGLLIINFDLQ